MWITSMINRRHARRQLVNAYLVAADQQRMSRLDAADYTARSMHRIVDDDDLMADWDADALARLAAMAPDLDAMTPAEMQRLLGCLTDDMRQGDDGRW